QAGVEFEYAARFGEQQAEARCTKPAGRRRFAWVNRHRYFLSPGFLSLARDPPSPAMVTNMSENRSAIFGSKVNQLCISASGETFSILLIICCCSFSITAVCIGCISGSPKNS